MTQTQKIHCQHVSAIDDGEGGLEVVFEEEQDQEDGQYVLLQRLFLEELDVGEDPRPIYLEMQDPDLCGHHSKLDVKLTRNRFVFHLPPPRDQTVEVDFVASDRTYQKLKRVLGIILGVDPEG